MQTLSEALKALSISILPSKESKQRQGSQYLFYNETTENGRTLMFATFGDFARDVHGAWHGTDQGELTEDDKKAAKKFAKEKAKEIDNEKRIQWEAKQKDAEEFFDGECIVSGTTPYMERKNIRELFGARVFPHSHGSLVLVVPLKDVDGKLWNYQRIFPTKLSAGDKFMLEGARIEGLFHRIGPEPLGTSTVYICEGFATGASIFEGLGMSQTVFCAFNAGNILPVSIELRRKYPELKFVFCADDDRWPGKDGKMHHTGEKKCLAAKDEVGGEIRLPRFDSKHDDKRPTDFNDLHILEGLAIVKQQLTESTPTLMKTSPVVTKGKDKPPEIDVARMLLREYNDTLMAQDSDLFSWTGTHWKLCTTRELNRLRNSIQEISLGKYGSRDVDACFKTFMRIVKHVPEGVDLFCPHPFAVSMNNGTLHLQKNTARRFTLSFHDHSPLDFVTTCLPYDFPLPVSQDEIEPDLLRVELMKNQNEEFLSMLSRVWDDEDKEDKITLWSQVLGGCILPAFPKIVFVVGKPGTGKSSLIELASHLVSAKHSCSVDPTKFEGFNLETMLNKLVNFDADISTTRFLSDEMIKKVIDRMPVRINRKGVKDVYGTLPSMHIFGANQLPKSREAAIGAYDRRNIYIRTEAFQPKGEYDQGYAQFVYNENPQGFFNFALLGVLELIKHNGHYVSPASSRKEMDDWKQKSDTVELFVAELKTETVRLKNDFLCVDTNARIERKALWEVFTQWHQEEWSQAPRLGRSTFMSKLERKGFEVRTIMGTRYFSGIGLRQEPNAQF